MPKQTALRVVALEFCFDDDPEDLETIRGWEEDELEQLRRDHLKGKLRQQRFNRLRYLEEKYRL